MQSLSRNRIEPSEAQALRTLDPRGVPIALIANELALLLQPRAFALLFLAIACYIISAFVGNEWSYLVPASLASAVLLGLAMPIFEMMSITVNCKVISPPSKRDDTKLNVSIKRKEKMGFLSRLIPAGYLAAHIILLRKVLKHSEATEIRLPIPAVIESLSHGFTATLSVPALTRGVYVVDRMEVASCFPFGVAWCLRAVAPSENTDTIIVYPTMYSMSGGFAAKLAPCESANGRRLQNWMISQSMNIRSIREFTERDSLTHIHWSLSARSGRLMVREFEHESQSEYDVVLDAAADWQEAQFELAVALAWSLIQHGSRLSFQPELLLLPNDSPDLAELFADIPGGIAGRQMAAEVLARLHAVPKTDDDKPVSATGERALVGILPHEKKGIQLVELTRQTKSRSPSVRQTLGVIMQIQEISRL